MANFGLYWTDLGQQFSQQYILSFAYLGNGIALAGTGHTDGKILRSTDYGATWTDLGQQYSQLYILSFAYLGSGIVLAGTATGGKILRSTDYGVTWTDLGQQFSQTYILSLAYLESGIALAGTGPDGKILRSTDYGATWTDLGQQYSQERIDSLAYLESGIVLAGTATGGKILRSTDYGATWTDLGQQFSQTYIFSLAYLESGIALAGTYIGGKILRSTDYGATWTDLGQQYSQERIGSLAYLGSGIALAGTAQSGKILRSTDYGVTWADLGQQFSQIWIAEIVYLGNGIVLVGTAPDGKILRSMNWLNEANKHVNTPVVFISIAFNSGTRYYSSDYVRTSTQGYKGNIANFPQIASSLGDIKRTYERNKIVIIFNDFDYEFRGLETTETVSFKNRTVTISIAFKEDNYISPLTLFVGYVYDWRRLDNLKFEFDVEEKSLNLENEYPDKRVERTDYPNADGTAVGWIIPIPYGTISALGLSGDGGFGHPSLSPGGSGTGLLFVDTTVDAEKHLVGRQSAAITVDRVYKNGVLQTLNVHYTIASAVVDGQTHTTINWVAGVNPTASDFISCDITFGSRRPVEAIRHFLETFCGYTYATDFKTANYVAATTVETNRSYAFDGALWEKKPLRSILDDWRDELEFDIYWDKNGLLCFNYLTTVRTVTSIYTEVRDILEGFDSDPQVDKIINYLKYGYNFHYSKTYYHNYNAYQNTDSQTKYGAVFKDFKGFDWIRSASMANDIASRKIIRFKDPITFDQFRLPLKSFAESLTGLVKITHFEGTGSSGYSDKYFQIRAFSFDIDNFINTILLEDASSFAGKACILGDDTVIDNSWATASGSERDYCYLCDGGTEKFLDGEPGKRLFD